MDEKLRKENESRTSDDAIQKGFDYYSKYTDGTKTALDRKKEASKQKYYRDSEFMGKGNGGKV